MKKQTPKVQYKVKVPWAEELTPMPDLPPEESPVTMATPTSETATPPKAPSSTSTPKESESPKKKDKKHKKKKKKKKHKKNKEKEKKEKKKKGRDSGHSTPRSDISSINETGSEKGSAASRSMLRNITNNSDFIPFSSGSGKRRISQVLNSISGRVPKNSKNSGLHFGVIPSIPTIQYYGHDPSSNCE